MRYMDNATNNRSRVHSIMRLHGILSRREKASRKKHGSGILMQQNLLGFNSLLCRVLVILWMAPIAQGIL